MDLERKLIFMYDLFSEFFNGFDYFPETVVYKSEAKCPVCGRTYSDFRKTGKLGCGKCYSVFRTPLASTMRQIHQNPAHVGKIPSRSNSELKLKRKYESLKQQLAKAVENEDYEAAAKLHKEIKDMESNNRKQ